MNRKSQAGTLQDTVRTPLRTAHGTYQSRYTPAAGDFARLATDPDAKTWIQSEFRQWGKNAQHVHDALHRYKNSAYQRLNEELRCGFEHEEHRRLDRAIASHTLSQPVVTYRGVIDGDERLHRLTEGAELEDDGYWSTSLLQDIAWGFASTGTRPEHRVVLRIFLDPSAHTINTVAPDLVEEMHEYELLLPRGSRFALLADPELRRAPKADNAPYYLIDVELMP